MKKMILAVALAIFAFSATTTTYAAETSVPTEQTSKPKKKKGEVKEVHFSVDVHCNNCRKKIMENISFEKGVKGLNVCMEDKLVSIKYDDAKTSEQALMAALEKLGFKATKATGGHNHNH
jgi:copper chaperone CopZ